MIVENLECRLPKMTITGVQIQLCRGEERLRAFVNIEVDGCFVIHRAKIIEAGGKTILCFPSRKAFDNGDRDDYKDVCHPTTQECRNYFNTIVLGHYYMELEKSILGRDDDRSESRGIAESDKGGQAR